MPTERAIALTIAGSDSGGGAGMQADLKTFQALGVHGTSVVTAITAQNPASIFAIEACSAKIIQKQLDAVYLELAPDAVKVGMLYTLEAIETTARFLKHHSTACLIIDPVMMATSGAALLRPRAAKLLFRELVPQASLITPNLNEAQSLLGREIRTVPDLRRAARDLHGRFGCAALVKGGHLHAVREAVDFFYDGKTELMLKAPFVRGVATHGTGCTYSAAITALCARGLLLPAAVAKAKHYVSNAIAQGESAHGHFLLNHQPAL